MLLDYLKHKIWIWRVQYEVSDEDKNTIFEKTHTNLWLWANYMIIFLILLSVVIVWLDSIKWFHDLYWYQIFVVDFFISVIFLFEYLYRWRNSSDKWIFPFRFLNLLDLASFLPFFILIVIYWVWSYSIFAIFRIFRIFRIYELVQKIPIIKKIWVGINKYRREYLTAVFVIFIMLTLSSTLVYLFEQKWWNSELFSSIPNTFWWSIVTLSTTWYWEMIPISIWWKIIASILMILWPILIAVISTITVIIFINSTKIINLKIDDLRCSHCNSENDRDAIFCKKCWEKIKEE